MSEMEFIKAYKEKINELIRNENIQEYAIIKCGFSKDDNFYRDCIKHYKNRQIDPNWKFTEWFLPKDLKEKVILLKIVFQLKKHFISSDDDIYYPKENPICKDKGFKIPMMRASSWKGALRYVAMRYILEGNNNEKIKRRLIMLKLFGTEKDSIEEFLNRKFRENNLLEKWKKEVKKLRKRLNVKELHLRGRLIFFPTFFNQINLDVIAPHDRKTKTVKNPILIEIVPENTRGEFYLLYYPFNLIEKLFSDKKEVALKEIKEDFDMLIEIIPNMFEVYGFGAKTSSGYGIAKIEKIYVNNKDVNKNWDKVLEVVENEYKK